MNGKMLITVGILCIALFIGLAFVTDAAYAQDSQLGKTGTQLGQKEWDPDQLPGALEKSLGVGSIFVMVAVLKWL